MTYRPGYEGWSATLYNDTLYILYSSALWKREHVYTLDRYREKFRVVRTNNSIVDNRFTTEEEFVAALIRGEI